MTTLYEVRVCYERQESDVVGLYRTKEEAIQRAEAKTAEPGYWDAVEVVPLKIGDLDGLEQTVREYNKPVQSLGDSKRIGEGDHVQVTSLLYKLDED